MANTSATWQQATHTSYQLLPSSCSAKPNSEEKYFKKKGEKLGELTISRKTQDRKSKMTSH